jgi:hypothetical protein
VVADGLPAAVVAAVSAPALAGLLAIPDVNLALSRACRWQRGTIAHNLTSGQCGCQFDICSDLLPAFGVCPKANQACIDSVTKETLLLRELLREMRAPMHRQTVFRELRLMTYRKRILGWKCAVGGALTFLQSMFSTTRFQDRPCGSDRRDEL